MSRQPGRSVGRRIAVAASRPSRSLLAPLVALVVTLAGLALAGLAAGDSGAAPPAPPRQAVGDRVFSCAGRIPQATAVTGSLDRGARTRPVREPARVHVPHDRATGAFAAQVATPGASYALGACPEPANDWWFVGAGGSVGHSTTLVVDNPRPGAAVVDIEVLGPRGEVTTPGLRGITLAGDSSRVFDLTKVAPSNGELAAHVTTSRGLVSVTAVDSFTLGAIGGVTREWLPAQGPAERDVTLVGLRGEPSNAVLLVANPGSVESIVDLTLVGPKGPFTPKGSESVTVAPGAVARLPITTAFDGDPFAVRLSGSGPVVATVRTVGGGDQAYAPAARPLDGTSVVTAPAGTGRRLAVTAGEEQASLTVTPHAAGGRALKAATVQVESQTTQVVRLPSRARYAEIRVTDGHPVAGLVAGAGSAGAALAVPPAVGALTLPAVRPAW